jgi:Subtilase family/Secretion system C-terminal sorting domain
MASRIGSILTALLLVVLFIGTVQAAPTLIGQELQPVLDEADVSEMISVVVLMAERHDVAELSAMVEGLRVDDRKAVMWSEVSMRADQSQEALLDHLYNLEQSNSVERIRSLKMANAISFNGTASAINSLTARNDIFAIHHMVEEKVIEDPVESPFSDELDEIVTGIAIVDAPGAWDMGFTGEGVLLAIIDTGCNYNHLDIADHMWDGGGPYPNHGYDFYNSDNNPLDDNGHGSHCAGTALGDGTAGSQTGVAPDATLMALKIFSSGGSGVESDCWDALDFCLEHGVDVTSLSAGWTNAVSNIRATFRDNYNILNAAGIVSIVASGNEGQWGQIPNQVRTPGTVPPPWLHPDQVEAGTTSGVITAGATEDNDTIAGFSSRGPVTWGSVPGYNDFDYNPGQGLLRPDLCAPGVNVKSLQYSGNNGYTSAYSGTSMATPHIAGAAALLFSTDPNLTPAQICEALELGSVELGAAGKDNTFGSGRLDCVGSITHLGNLADINVILNPLFTPYYIQSSGGTMQFAVTINNSYGSNTSGVVWTEAIMPNGSTYPIQTYNVVYQPGVSISVPAAQQNVPANAPSGTYSFNVHAGLSFGVPIDSESFEFIKFANFPNPDGSEGWDQNEFEMFTADEESGDVIAPTEFALGKAYPNPFNPTTSVSLSLPMSELVTVSVFNALGQEVAQLQNGRLSAGQHSFTFDASSLSSGVYFISAQAGVETSMQKVVLMK